MLKDKFIILPLICSMICVSAFAQLPGTGVRVNALSDDFENSTWFFNRSGFGGTSSNGMWYGSFRGAPEFLNRTTPLPGGVPGQKGALQIRTYDNDGDGYNNQEDFVTQFHETLYGRYLTRADQPSFMAHIYLPPYSTVLKTYTPGGSDEYSTLGFRIEARSSQVSKYYPSIWLQYYDYGGDYPNNFGVVVRMGDGQAQDVYVKNMGANYAGGWVKVGISFDSAGVGHFYFKEGVAPFTSADKIYDTTMFPDGSNAKMDWIAYHFITIGYAPNDPDVSPDYRIEDVSVFIAGTDPLGCPSFNNAMNKGTIPSTLTETSGIAASRKNTDVLWMLNDSGAGAVIYAVNTNGALLGSYTINGATNRDWEDIAVGPGPDPAKQYIYIGDIGGNISNYGDIKVYRVEEPVVASNQSPPITATLTDVSTITLYYPAGDGWFDAETLMVDPWTKDIYVITKGNQIISGYTVPANGRIYCAAYPYTNTTMAYKGTISVSGCTGGDISPNGTLVTVRNYTNAYVWRINAVQAIWEALLSSKCSVPLVSGEPQGESICFEGQNRGYFTVSEGTNQPLYFYKRNALNCSEVREMNAFLLSDFTEDCQVGVADLMILAGNWLNSL